MKLHENTLVQSLRGVWPFVNKCHYCKSFWAETKPSCAPKTRAHGQQKFPHTLISHLPLLPQCLLQLSGAEASYTNPSRCPSRFMMPKVTLWESEWRWRHQFTCCCCEWHVCIHGTLFYPHRQTCLCPWSVDTNSIPKLVLPSMLQQVKQHPLAVNPWPSPPGMA